MKTKILTMPADEVAHRLNTTLAKAKRIIKAVNNHDALVGALRQMLTFSDSRMKSGSRTIEEASFADRVSDLLAETEGK
jgi:hypothetical protein